MDWCLRPTKLRGGEEAVGGGVDEEGIERRSQSRTQGRTQGSYEGRMTGTK
jgi:hypothetical protein